MTDFPNSLKHLGIDEHLVIDVASVIHRNRPYGLLHVPRINKTNVCNILSNIGLRIIHTRRLVRVRDLNSREGTLVSVFSPENSNLDEWYEIWFCRLDYCLTTIEDLELHTGKTLGYPPCCVERNKSLKSLAPYYHEYLFSKNPGFWEINRLASVFSAGMIAPDFFPCSLSCQAARDLAQSYLPLGIEYLGQQKISKWCKDLQSPITLWDGKLFHWKEWVLDHGVLHLNTISSKYVKLEDIASVSIPSWIKADQPWLVPFNHLSTVNELFIHSKGTGSVHIKL